MPALESGQQTVTRNERILTSPKKPELSAEQLKARAEKINGIIGYIKQQPNGDITNLVYAAMDGSATPEEIYYAILRSKGENNIISFSRPNGTKMGIDFNSKANHETRARVFTSILNAAAMSPGCKLELNQSQNIKTKEGNESKEQTEGEVLFNEFTQFALRNQQDVIRECIGYPDGEYVMNKDAVSDYFYENFYSGNLGEQVKPTNEQKEKYQENLNKIAGVCSLIQSGGWNYIDQGNINKHSEEEIGRIYFNTDPAFGPKLLYKLQTELSKKIKTFQAKIPSSYEDRKDNCVLYLQKKTRLKF